MRDDDQVDLLGDQAASNALLALQSMRANRLVDDEADISLTQ